MNGTDILTADDDLRWGWMVGGGLEYAFTGNWSMKIEYNYMNFGNRGPGAIRGLPLFGVCGRHRAICLAPGVLENSPVLHNRA